jgi:hypothetical protein
VTRRHACQFLVLLIGNTNQKNCRRRSGDVGSSGGDSGVDNVDGVGLLMVTDGVTTRGDQTYMPLTQTVRSTSSCGGSLNGDGDNNVTDDERRCSIAAKYKQKKLSLEKLSLSAN